LPILRELLQRSEDAKDPHIPMLLWWAIENKALAARELFVSPEVRRAPIVQKFILERLARRYMAAGADDEYLAAAGLLEIVKGSGDIEQVLAGMEQALEGRSLPRVPERLERHLSDLAKSKQSDLSFLRLTLRLGDRVAYDRALALVSTGQ